MQQPEPDRLVQAAVAEMVGRRFDRALDLLNAALALEPNHLMALTRLAEIRAIGKDFDSALTLTQRVLAAEPYFAPAWFERAAALWGAARQVEASAAARQAATIQPAKSDYRLRYGAFAAWTGDEAGARSAIAPLLEPGRTDPSTYATAVAVAGEIAVATARFDEGLRYLDQALGLKPDLHAARMLHGMNQLRLGRFRDGWANYASRQWVDGINAANTPTRATALWTGQDLRGKTLLVEDDQGHGDSIQFFRYLPLLRDRGVAHVMWRTFPPLNRLLAAAAPYATVVCALPDAGLFDYQCSSTSLPQVFDTELHTIPPLDPVLKPPARLKSGMKLPSGRRPRVGLVWSGDIRHKRDHLRSIPARLILRLADLPGIAFHSLQHEVRPGDLADLTARPAIVREIEKAVDFADTAALIARLDLVIAVDTGTAHLAAAMGKPTWLIVHITPDWRWLTERSDSPWYPSIRIFRVTPAEWRDNPDSNGWAPVLERVAEALQGFAPR